MNPTELHRGAYPRPVALVIDDEPSVLRYMRGLLELEGFDVYEALEGPLGLELVPAVQPNVVLVDVMMPGVGGIEVCGRMLALRPGLPVVVLTAWDDDEVRQRATAAGAAAFLTKPLLPGQLTQVLGRLLPAS